MRAPLLETAGLVVGRKAVPTLSGLDITLAPGDFVGLIGPNGAGKSTVLMTLSGILPPLAGRITLGDRDLSSLRARERARILTYLPQDPEEDDGFSVQELVELGRTPHRGLLDFGPGEADQIAVRDALQGAGALPLAGRRLGTLSGGERQRARIAMALAQAPKVLLADEPTGALDLTGQLDLMTLLASLAARGLGVLAVLHDLNLAAQFCTRLLVVAGGQLLAQGPPRTVLTEEILWQAFGAAVLVAYHPQTGAPFLLPRFTSDRGNLEQTSEARTSHAGGDPEDLVSTLL